MEPNQYPGCIAYKPVTIAMDATDSTTINIHGATLVGLSLPSAFTGTSVTIHGSIDGVTFKPLYKDGADLSVTVAAGKHVIIQPADLVSVQWIRLVAGTAQVAARSIDLALRPL